MPRELGILHHRPVAMYSTMHTCPTPPPLQGMVSKKGSSLTSQFARFGIVDEYGPAAIAKVGLGIVKIFSLKATDVSG